MNLKKVTLTGADDSIDPKDLIELSKCYPFVEWGILISKSQMGGSRFPSANWLKWLCEEVKRNNSINLSMHLCGRWLRELMLGMDVFDEIPVPLSLFQRVQLNFHADKLNVDRDKFYRILASKDCEFIFQIDGNDGQGLLEGYFEDHGNASPLFDLSHGAGVSPDQWPVPVYMLDDVNHSLHGYAGGIGPGNVLSQLEKIKSVVGDVPIWIDMETKLRTEHDAVFDYSLCRSVLEQCEQYFTEIPTVGH